MRAAGGQGGGDAAAGGGVRLRPRRARAGVRISWPRGSAWVRRLGAHVGPSREPGHLDLSGGDRAVLGLPVQREGRARVCQEVGGPPVRLRDEDYGRGEGAAQGPAVDGRRGLAVQRARGVGAADDRHARVVGGLRGGRGGAGRGLQARRGRRRGGNRPVASWEGRAWSEATSELPSLPQPVTVTFRAVAAKACAEGRAGSQHKTVSHHKVPLSRRDAWAVRRTSSRSAFTTSVLNIQPPPMRATSVSENSCDEEGRREPQLPER